MQTVNQVIGMHDLAVQYIVDPWQLTTITYSHKGARSYQVLDSIGRGRWETTLRHHYKLATVTTQASLYYIEACSKTQSSVRTTMHSTYIWDRPSAPSMWYCQLVANFKVKFISPPNFPAIILWYNALCTMSYMYHLRMRQHKCTITKSLKKHESSKCIANITTST